MTLLTTLTTLTDGELTRAGFCCGAMFGALAAVCALLSAARRMDGQDDQDD